MTFSRWGAVLAAWLTFFAVARAEQVIVSDGFGGADKAPVQNRWPDTTNLPGATWEVVGFDNGGGFGATLTKPAAGGSSPAKAFVTFNCAGNSTGLMMVPIQSAGPYVKPTQLTISADLGSPNGASPLLGFYPVLGPKAKRDKVEQSFSGLELVCNGAGNADDGTLILFQSGVAGAKVPFKGTFVPKALHHLSYDVDTSTGAISNVSLQGSASDYSAFKSGAFIDPATACAAVAVLTTGRDTQANIANFKLTTAQNGAITANTAPPAAPDGLTVVKGQEGWNSVVLEWKKSNGSYSVYRGTAPNGEEGKPIAANVVTTKYVDHDLTDGNTYYYKVKAANPYGVTSSNEVSYQLDNPLYRDKTEYPPLNFTWSTRTDITQVRGVFPHLFLQQRAFVATEAGLLMSDDDGHTWSNLPEASVDKVGPVTAIAFHPVQADTFYIASQTKGVWMTTDNGQTFTQIGSKAKGMAADAVADFIIYPGDAEHETLLAVHGDAAQGISRSRDGGKNWDVVNTDYHFSRVFGGEGSSTQLYLFGAAVKQPDIQSVYTTHTVGEYIAEVIRDVVPTDLAFAPVPFRGRGLAYVTTSDSGLICIDNSSVFGMAFDTTKLAYPNVDGWASAGVTWGPTPESLNLFLFDPTKTGLVIANNVLSDLPQPAEDISNAPASINGLPVSPITGEGAVLRPNANGTVCYAVINNAFSIGRLPDDVPVVALNPGGVQANPNDDKEWRDLAESFNKLISDKASTVDAAKNLLKSTPDLEAQYRSCQITVTVQVPIKPAPPKSVTIDLSRYGGLPETQLFDDGQHGDGAANDGVYGLTLAFLPARYTPHNEDPEWRCLAPGRIALGVVATYADGKKRAAVGVINYLQKISDLEMWNEGLDKNAVVPEKGVTAEVFRNPLAPGQPDYAPRPHKGDVAVRLNVPKGPWTVHFKANYNRHDIDSYAGMSFYVKLEQGDQPTDFYLQLLDQPEFSAPTLTDKAPLLNGMKLGGEYQRVSLPIGRILGPGSHFQTDNLDEIIISGDSPAPATLDIDQMAAIATYPPPEPPPDHAQ